MPRRKIFYAANQISEAQYAKAGEFVDNETLEPYEGVYCIADETFLTGATPSLESRVLREATGVFGKKFEDANSSKYFQLTRKEYVNHSAPQVFFPEPDEEDYERGQIIRYFVQKKNEANVIHEIDEIQFKAVNKENKEGINDALYRKFQIQWMLTGVDAIKINEQNVAIHDTIYPGIRDYLINFSQFVRDTSNNTEIKYYPNGTEIDVKLPESYGQSPDANAACLNCKFRHKNFCSNWQAVIRRNYWCQSWKGRPVPYEKLAQDNLYTEGGEYLLNGTDYVGSYHIHPDKGAMVGAYHISEPHEYLTPISSLHGGESTYNN